MSDIVIVGSLNMDIVVSVPHIPKVGETILASEINHYGGGKGANQAVAAARLGSKVSMIGKIGSDENGEVLLSALRKEGIDTTGMEVSDGITGSAFINVSESGDNNIVVYPGANNDLNVEQIEKYREIIEKSKVCVLQMEIPYEVVKYVVNLCYEKGVKVVFNPAPATKEIEEDLISKTHILIPNETELFILAEEDDISLEKVEEVARKILNKGCENLIVTLGSKGSMYLQEDKVQYFESKKINAVDTTAAGDSFVGALVTGIVEGKSIPESIDFASYVAALTVTKLGAQNSLPTKKEVEDFIKKYSKEEN